jgi:outer membrane protein assembly factor BamB
VWSVEQTRLDDQRDSMPAAAPTARGEILLGTGSRSGILESRRASDGVLLWRRGLLAGAVSNRDSDNALSSVLAVDLDRTGPACFVVGGFDGWLYALESTTGRLLWTMDLGAPVGDPIAADIDGTGRSVILVPASNGYLYAIGPAP